jgi:hypothetical protein
MTITKIEDDIQLSREQKIEAHKQIIYYNFIYFIVSVLYLLGIHKIDSIKYNLSPDEFFK